MSLVSGLLNQNIDSISSVSLDGYGDSTPTIVYSNVPCRWEEKVERVISPTLGIMESSVSVWLLPVYEVEYNYVIIKGSETYKMVSREYKYDITGRHDHTKLYLV